VRRASATPPRRAANAQYSLAAPESLAVKIAAYQRRKMYAAFLALGIGDDDEILDVGVTSDRSFEHSNYLELWHPHKARLTAVGVDDASHLPVAYPGVRFVRADGRALPFADAVFDFVHSSAVLEHVGSRAQQARFVAELARVARKGVFLTTPNRWFPVEFHTLMPLVHWLPPRLFRRLLVALGRDFFAAESNLNLLSAGQIRAMAEAIGLSGYEVRGLRLLGWPANLLFILRKPAIEADRASVGALPPAARRPAGR